VSDYETLQSPPRPPKDASRPELLGHIEALEALLARALKVIVEQGERIEKLEQEVRESKRQATPFRRKKRKDKSKHKKPGRKGGHQRERRAEPKQVDESHEAIHAEQCPCCGDAVETVDSYTQTQEDIHTEKRTRQFTVYVGKCTGCGEKVEGRHPFQTSTARGSASQQLGPLALALAAHLHYGEGMPFDKLREHFAQLGLKVSTSALVRAMDRIASRGRNAFEALLDQVLSQEVLHIDETGWSIAGEPCWLWVLSGKDATVYFVRKTRSSDEVADFLKDFKGVMVTDGAKAYDKLGKKLTRALCLLHLRRNAKALEEKQTGGAVCVPRALVDWLDRTIALVGQRDELSRRAFRRQAKALEREFEQTFVACQPTNAANRRMVERLRTWHDAVVRSLRDMHVPATNNHAERQVRPSVVTRKRGGCNRSERGVRAFEVITSLLVSARQKKVDFVDWLVALLRQDPLQPQVAFW